MAQQREVDRWRNEADQAIREANRVMNALLWAADQLVKLQYMHVADDFAHCPVCKEPFPCETAQRIRDISQVFERATNGDTGE